MILLVVEVVGEQSVNVEFINALKVVRLGLLGLSFLYLAVAFTILFIAYFIMKRWKSYEINTKNISLESTTAALLLKNLLVWIPFQASRRAYQLVRRSFIFQESLPIDFRFDIYLKRCTKRSFSGLANIHWSVLLLAVGLTLAIWLPFSLNQLDRVYPLVISSVTALALPVALYLKSFQTFVKLQQFCSQQATENPVNLQYENIKFDPEKQEEEGEDEEDVIDIIDQWNSSKQIIPNNSNNERNPTERTFTFQTNSQIFFIDSNSQGPLKSDSINENVSTKSNQSDNNTHTHNNITAKKLARGLTVAQLNQLRKTVMKKAVREEKEYSFSDTNFFFNVILPFLKRLFKCHLKKSEGAKENDSIKIMDSNQMESSKPDGNDAYAKIRIRPVVFTYFLQCCLFLQAISFALAIVTWVGGFDVAHVGFTAIPIAGFAFSFGILIPATIQNYCVCSNLGSHTKDNIAEAVLLKYHQKARPAGIMNVI